MLTMIVVTGQYVAADGSPATGQVELELTRDLLDAAGHVVFESSPRIVPIKNGLIQKRLAATDDAGVQPIGVVYRVTERIVGLPDHVFTTAVPHTAQNGVFDLSAAG